MKFRRPLKLSLLDNRLVCRRRALLLPSMMINVSQAVHQLGISDDRLAMTLTRNCGNIYAPLFGALLTPEQCWALHGAEDSQGCQGQRRSDVPSSGLGNVGASGRMPHVGCGEPARCTVGVDVGVWRPFKEERVGEPHNRPPLITGQLISRNVMKR